MNGEQLTPAVLPRMLAAVMKTKNAKPAADRDRNANTKKVRTSVSLPPKVWDWMLELSESQGFDTWTSYIAELIRRDKLAHEEKVRLRGTNPDQSN